MFREEICSGVLRELLDVCVEPLNCTSPVLAGVVLELLLDEIRVPLESFRVHVIHCLALLHDVLQHRRVFVETCP